jgi:NAD-dependent deacetylase
MSVWGTESWESEETPSKKGREGLPDRITKDTVISVLSGAGISAESGIPTFRGENGMWNDPNLVRIATPSGFSEDPVRGWRFYDERRANMLKAQPNPAHIILAALEKAGYNIAIITQNIDRLHQRAGSTRVIELHGTVWEFRCSNSSCRSAPVENHDVPLKSIPPLCDKCGEHLRPNVVFFEEMLDMDDIRAADDRTKITDLFLVIGTSGVVYPAAAYAQVARMCGAYVMEFNVESTPLSPYCDVSILGPCGETLPAAIARMTEGAVTIG